MGTVSAVLNRDKLLYAVVPMRYAFYSYYYSVVSVSSTYHSAALSIIAYDTTVAIRYDSCCVVLSFAFRSILLALCGKESSAVVQTYLLLDVVERYELKLRFYFYF